MQSIFSPHATHTTEAQAIAAERAALRRALRQRRQQLTADFQQQAAQQLVTQVLTHSDVQTAERIALYHSFGAELGTQPLMDALLAAGKKLCLPVLHPFAKGHLLMLNVEPHSEYQLNTFGIPEPPLDVRNVVRLSEIDCMLVPLVGFDLNGQRIGMGGGFYDRTLAGWAHGRYPNLHVLGLAHDCQQVDRIPTQPWDVALGGVITPTQSWRFSVPHSV